MTKKIICNKDTAIGRLRAKIHFTQTELGEMLAVGQNTISQWENHVIAPNLRRMQQLVDIAKRYGVRMGLTSLCKEYANM
jgi:transcriptional regulator with XRE-family HTH domain